MRQLSKHVVELLLAATVGWITRGFVTDFSVVCQCPSLSLEEASTQNAAAVVETKGIKQYECPTQKTNKTQNMNAPTQPKQSDCTGSVKKKVISFALFHKTGANSNSPLPDWLLIGIEANRLGWHFYLPDWTVRIYIGPGVSDDVVKNLTAVAQTDPMFEVTPLPLGNIPSGHPNFHTWMLFRLFVADDPTVERFIVRDLDGRPSIREVMAINDWIRSGKSLHTIRDHKGHSVPIMGGMWGATDQMFPRIRARSGGNLTMRQLVENFLRSPPSGFTDQTFLQSHLWGHVAADTWAHDIIPTRAFCKASDGCHAIPQSVRWDEFFIGQPFKITTDDPVVTRRAATRDYECWSTCTIGPPIDCSCKADTFKKGTNSFTIPKAGTMT